VRKVLGLRVISPGLEEGSLLRSGEHPLLLYCNAREKEREGERGMRKEELLVMRRMEQYAVMCSDDIHYEETTDRRSCGVLPQRY
jgi:hypothetical protein